MTKLSYEIEFPCGYKWKMKLNTWAKIIEGANLPLECPIHGKNCNKLLEKKK